MLSNNPPLRSVSIIMPCRNEAEHVSACLDSVLSNDYPKELIEIIVVDAESNDATREIVGEYIEKNPNITLLSNPDKITPKALNIGIGYASGDILIRMDFHSRYCTNYISTLVYHLDKLNCDNVGGVWKTLPSGTGIIPRGIALATSLPFGIGNAWYRLGKSKVTEVDTVPYGCYRKEIFEKIGHFDEELIRNQDDEFNARLKKNGGKIYLIPDAIIDYYARGSIKGMSKMFYQYGFYKPLVNMKIGIPATIRQIIPPLFIVYLLVLLILIILRVALAKPILIILALYIIINIAFSIYSVIRNRDIALIFILPFLFPIIHISYGSGYIFGLIFHSIRWAFMKAK